MLIYLDHCSYNRPFDNQSQIKIQLETQAKLFIQSNIRDGKYDLVWSYMLDYENSKNPFEEKRIAISPWKNMAKIIITEESEELLSFAEHLSEKGIKPFDALHIACAVAAHCDYFITTDRKLLNTPISEIKITSPVLFINEVEVNHENGYSD